MDQEVQERIRKELNKHCKCFVVVACSEPSADGQMQVDMMYEGDPTLAAYLLEGAQGYIDNQLEEEEEEESPDLRLHSKRSVGS